MNARRFSWELGSGVGQVERPETAREWLPTGSSHWAFSPKLHKVAPSVREWRTLTLRSPSVPSWSFAAHIADATAQCCQDPIAHAHADACARELLLSTVLGVFPLPGPSQTEKHTKQLHTGKERTLEVECSRIPHKGKITFIGDIEEKYSCPHIFTICEIKRDSN